MGSVLSKGLDHSNRPMGTELLWVPHPCGFLAQEWETRTRAAVRKNPTRNETNPVRQRWALTVCLLPFAKREEWGTPGSCDIGENQNPRFRIQARMCIPEIHRIVSP